MTARCFVDSNVLIYLLEGGEKASRASEVVGALFASNTCVVSPQVIGEVFVNVERISSRDEADELAADLAAAAFVQPLDAGTTSAARDISRRFALSYWDAQICAAAAASGASVLLSEDLQDGQVVAGVRIRNPFAHDFDLGDLA